MCIVLEVIMSEIK